MEQARKPREFSRTRKFFGWIFILSLLIFLVSGVMTTLDMRAGDKAAPPPSPDTTAPVMAMETDNSMIVLGASLVTVVTSSLGFISTTILGWRREKREVAAAARDAQIKDLELQKLKRELGQQD